MTTAKAIFVLVAVLYDMKIKGLIQKMQKHEQKLITKSIIFGNNSVICSPNVSN